jgi:hypothetical protein
VTGLGGGGGKLLVETRWALFDEGFFHAACDQELFHVTQTLLELLVITVAQDDGQSWTEGRLEVVAAAGIEPATRGFSIRCSTN